MSEQNREPSGEDELREVFQAMGQASRDADAKRSQELVPQVWAALSEKLKNEPEHPCAVEWKIAHQREAAFDWRGAEAAFKRAIEAEVAEGRSHPRGHRFLARFYSFVGREEEAFQLALQITEDARSREDWLRPMELAQALQSEAAWHLKRGDERGARGLLEESLQITEPGPGKRHLEMFSRHACLGLARCDIASGDLDASLRKLEEMWPALEPWQDAGLLAGWQSVLSSWWRARALLWEACGQDDAAAEAWRQHVHFCRVLTPASREYGPYEHNALAQALHSLGRALERAGQPLALHAFAESRSIRRSIGLDEIKRE